MTEPRYINVNDLGRYTVEIGGHRYVPWVALAEVPTADTMVHGEWNQVENREWEDNGPVWVCSKCNRMMYAAWMFGRKIADFCPYCGAKMDGGNSDVEK